MSLRKRPDFSRREREIMDIIYARGEATAADVREGLSGNPSYSTVRALLRILEDKGHLQHREKTGRYVYLPTEPRSRASKSALQRVVQTFFKGSLSGAVAALVDAESARLSADELRRIEMVIETAKKRKNR